MKPGERFEIECLEYLQEKYGSSNIIFKHQDTSDSTRSDIEVIINKKTSFFIEAKDPSAHSGQFVLHPNEENKEFIFPKGNKSNTNYLTDIIIEYMNSEFQRFNNADTAGEKIKLDSSVFSTWIVNYYKQKNVKYFISKYKSNFVIFPIDKFSNYFTPDAKFRIKKSGSGKPAKKNINNIISELRNNYSIQDYTSEEKRLFVKTNESLAKTYFSVNENQYYLSPTEYEDTFEVRRLSNTRNKNVIFSIELIADQNSSDLLAFEKELLQ